MLSFEERLLEIQDIDYVSEFTYEVLWPLQMMTIEMIDIVGEHRQKGRGTAIMKEVISMAIDNGLTVRLRPDDKYGTPIKVLCHFYEKLGFKWDAKSSEYYFN